MDQKRYEQSIQCVSNADSARCLKTEAQTAIITPLVLFYVHAANVQLSAFGDVTHNAKHPTKILSCLIANNSFNRTSIKKG